MSFIQPNLSIKVALFTTVEKYNDDQFINHHGFQRNVRGGNLKEKSLNGVKVFKIGKKDRI